MDLSPLGLMAAGLARNHIGGNGTLIAMGALLLAASALFAAPGALHGARV